MNAPIRIYVPRDAAALAVDADAVARAIEVAAEQRGLAAAGAQRFARTAWLEPMVEIATPAGRVAYGPVQPRTWPACSRPAGCRATPTRCGWVRPRTSLPEAPGTPDLRPRRRDRPAVAAGLRRARRPGGLSAHCPWRPRPSSRNSSIPDCAAVAARPSHRHQMEDGGGTADQKYIVCNADEGDSGTYADRLLMEGDRMC